MGSASLPCSQAPFIDHMCVGFSARLLTSPVPHVRCASCALCRSKSQSECLMSRSSILPFQLRSLLLHRHLHLHLVGVGWVGAHTYDTHSLGSPILGFSRVATFFPSVHPRRFLALRVPILMTLLLHRRGLYHPMSTPLL